MGRSKYTRVLWRNLPADVLERILAFLPLHVLCRFRLVCKAWNHCISGSEFASLRIQATQSLAPSIIFISPTIETYVLRAESPRWNLVDAEEKKSYKVTNSFLTTLNTLFVHERWCKRTVAAVGGLVYCIYESRGFSRRHLAPVHVVCIPASKSFHEIPAPEVYPWRCLVTTMAVNPVTKAYMIVSILGVPSNGVHYFDLPYQYLVYESGTSKWRTLLMSNRTAWYQPYSCIFVSDVLYCLFDCSCRIIACQSHVRRPRLYRCDLARSALLLVDVVLPRRSHPNNRFLLVECLKRLFVVEFTAYKHGLNQVVTLTVWEVALELEKKEVVQHGATLQRFSEYTADTKAAGLDVADTVHAVGSGNCIVVSCVMGDCVKFDLRKKVWQKLPCHAPFNGDCRGICVGLVHL